MARPPSAAGAATRQGCRPHLANPARVDGVAVSANTAQNLYDTFIVENHGSFGPHYQEELWRTSGRNSAHFLAAGRALPEVFTGADAELRGRCGRPCSA